MHAGKGPGLARVVSLWSKEDPALRGHPWMVGLRACPWNASHRSHLPRRRPLGQAAPSSSDWGSLDSGSLSPCVTGARSGLFWALRPHEESGSFRFDHMGSLSSISPPRPLPPSRLQSFLVFTREAECSFQNVSLAVPMPYVKGPSGPQCKGRIC